MLDLNCLLEKGIITGEQLTSITQISSTSKRESLLLLVSVGGVATPEEITMDGEAMTMDGEEVTMR